MADEKQQKRNDPARAEATSAAACDKIIRNIARSAHKLNETIHNAALMVSEHARTFGDTSRAAALVDAMPMSHRRGLLVKWFDAFTAIGIGKDGKTGKMKGHLRGKTEERDAMWKLDAGKATPFYSDAFTGGANAAEPDIPTYESIHNNVVNFVKRLETAINGTPDKKKGEPGYKPAMPEGEDRQKATAELEAIKKAVAA